MIGTKRNGLIRKVSFSEIDFYFFEKEEDSRDEVARIDDTYSVLRPFISLNVLWNDRYCSGSTVRRMTNIHVMSVAPKHQWYNWCGCF